LFVLFFFPNNSFDFLAVTCWLAMVLMQNFHTECWNYDFVGVFKMFFCFCLQDQPPYNKGAFKIEIIFPAEYPFKPPKVRLVFIHREMNVFIL